jgi:hypothetical protein
MQLANNAAKDTQHSGKYYTCTVDTAEPDKSRQELKALRY